MSPFSARLSIPNGLYVSSANERYEFIHTFSIYPPKSNNWYCYVNKNSVGLFDKIGHCMGSIVFFDNIFILFRGQIACLLCDNRKALFGIISFLSVILLMFNIQNERFPIFYEYARKSIVIKMRYQIADILHHNWEDFLLLFVSMRYGGVDRTQMESQLEFC